MEPAESKNEAIINKAKSLANVPWSDDYERMISGMLYDAFVPALTVARFRARKLASKYNSPIPDDATEEVLFAQRTEVLTQLVGALGQRSLIEPPFNVDYGCNIILGDDFYSNFNLTILDCSLVTIGDRVLFGPNVSILSATHKTDVQSRRDGIEFSLPVTIGDDCWIGGNVVIIAGVTIGNGCTIGAGAVVNKSISPFSVAVGSPARVIKKVEEVGPMHGK